MSLAVPHLMNVDGPGRKTIPSPSLYTGMGICGAMGARWSAQTSEHDISALPLSHACLHPWAEATQSTAYGIWDHEVAWRVGVWVRWTCAPVVISAVVVLFPIVKNVQQNCGICQGPLVRQVPLGCMIRHPAEAEIDLIHVRLRFARRR